MHPFHQYSDNYCYLFLAGVVIVRLIGIVASKFIKRYSRASSRAEHKLFTSAAMLHCQSFLTSSKNCVKLPHL